jgi:AraC-like DNA-binding protein
MFTLTFFALVLSVGMLLINSIPVGFFLATAVGATIIIYYVAYFFLLHPNALADISLNLRQSAGISAFNEPHQQKKNDSILPDFELKINHLLDTEKIYQKPDITIGELAHRAHIPVYLTSKIINQRLNTNFYSLINQYRLRQVKHELLQNPNKTIIEIAYNAGFNSKTSFYEAFKKDTGLSPSEFIRKNQSDK